MFITRHASERIEDRLLSHEAYEVLAALEAVAGESGTVAYIAARLVSAVICEDGSNGDTLVAVAVDGSVETVMFRRSWNQTLHPDHFGASKIVDLDRHEKVVA